MRIAFGTDEHTSLTDSMVARLRAPGHEVEVVADGDAWPDAGRHDVDERERTADRLAALEQAAGAGGRR